MAKQNRKETKQRSKRLKSKTKKQTQPIVFQQHKTLVQKSSRLKSAPVGSKYHGLGGAPASALPAVYDPKPPRLPCRQ